jgi:hypothetical protein
MLRLARLTVIGCAALCGCASAPQRPAPASQDPARFSYSRLYCTPDNESHFETVTIDLAKIDGVPPAPPVYARGSAATRLAFAGFEPQWGAQDLQARKFHAAPNAQFVVYLQGEMSITASDGETRRFGPGDVLRVEDTAPCKGHISVGGAQPSFTLISR